MLTETHSDFLVDQLRAAPYTHRVLHELLAQGLQAITETDIPHLKRKLCLPSASATAMNLFLHQRLIGDEGEERLRVGDIFKLLLPHHGKYISSELPKGWLVITPQGDMYHHAVIAFSQALNIPAYSVADFSSLEQFRTVIDNDGQAVISLDNKFVLDHTLARYNHDGLVFASGRHVVTILNFSGPQITLSDPFNLPHTKIHGLIVTLNISDANKYLTYSDNSPTRGIVFGTKPEDINISPTHIPSNVSTALVSQLHDLTPLNISASLRELPIPA